MDHESDSEDEQIVVTRQEEERDPEVEADFDREFEKMMAESMDSRRFERKAIFDIPLPMKRPAREATANESSESPEPIPALPVAPKTMAFSLMTKKGNKQQVRTQNPEKPLLAMILTYYRLVPLICPPIQALLSPCGVNSKRTVKSNNASRVSS
jgi:hypothetical protein